MPTGGVCAFVSTGLFDLLDHSDQSPRGTQARFLEGIFPGFMGVTEKSRSRAAQQHITASSEWYVIDVILTFEVVNRST